jgi:hypothetical protein
VHQPKRKSQGLIGYFQDGPDDALRLWMGTSWWPLARIQPVVNTASLKDCMTAVGPDGILRIVLTLSHDATGDDATGDDALDFGSFFYQMNEHNMNKTFADGVWPSEGADICTLGNRLLFVGEGVVSSRTVPDDDFDDDPDPVLARFGFQFAETTLLELNDVYRGPCD